MKTSLLVLCVSLLAFVSCSSNKEYPVKTTEENGVKTISNPDYPKEGVYDLVLEEKFTLGKEADNSKYIFSLPIDIKLDKNNNLYVLDWDCYKFFVFDENGKYLRSFGKQGKGPGDFETPLYFNINGDGKIVLNDGRNIRICFLDSLGNYLGGTTYKSFRSSLALDSKNNIYVTDQKELRDDLTSELRAVKTTETVQRVNSGNGRLEDVGTFPGQTIQMSQTANGSTITLSSSNGFWWAITPSDRIITGVADLYEFAYTGIDGKLLFKLTRKFSPFVNKDYKEGSKGSRYLSAFTKNTIVDNNGNLWVNLNNGRTPDNYIYDVYSEDGIFQKQIYSKYPVKLFSGNLAYSITRSEKEPVYIKAFKYSLKKRLK